MSTLKKEMQMMKSEDVELYVQQMLNEKKKLYIQMKMMNKLWNTMPRQFVRHVYLLKCIRCGQKIVTYIVQILKKNNPKDTAQHGLKNREETKRRKPK